MDEYIELKAFWEALENADPDVYEDYGGGAVDWGFGRKNIQDMIIGIPRADVAPVVHGRWSDAGFGELPKHAPYGWACSVCGGISFNNEYIYCPNCGAKMEGGNENA
jgi:hypothetical protein